MPSGLARRDLAVAWTITICLLIELLLASLSRAWALMGSFDLAYFRQATWFIRHGEDPFLSMRGLYLLADHAAYIMFPIGWITRIFPSQPTLLVIQASALAAGAMLLYLLARKVAELSTVLSAGVVLAYSLFPALHNVNLFDFHPEVVAVPAFIGAVYFGLRDRWLLYGLCLITAMSTREDIAVPVIVLGLLLACCGKRRAGAITAASAIALLAINLLFVMPHFAGGEYVQSGRFGEYGPTLVSAIKSMIRQPQMVLDDLTNSENFGVLLTLFSPVLFMPFTAFRWLLPGLPLQALYLLSSVPAAHTIDAQYTTVIIPFIFIAMVMGLRAKRWPERQLLTMLLLASVAFCYHYGHDAQNALNGGPEFHRASSANAVIEASHLVGPADSVAATNRPFQALAERHDLYVFPNVFDPNGFIAPRDPVGLQRRLADIDWLILDTSDKQQWSDGWYAEVSRAEAQGFRKVFDQAGVIALERG